MDSNVAVVIVTYNRLEKLSKALCCYEKQFKKPKYVIVVNNNSNDGTVDYLKMWQSKQSCFKKVVINLDENLGGSGGFYEGQKYAMQLQDVDWILISDDDAYPEHNYISGLCGFIKEHNKCTFSVVCGKVVEFGTYVNIHRRFLKNKWTRNFYASVPEKYFTKEYFNVDIVSYVGILVNREILKQVGLVNKDYFIWNDDVEHSCRLREKGEMVCVPQYYMVHDAEPSNFELSWKDYYGYRNNVCIFKKHFKLQMTFVVAVTIAKALLCPLKGKSITEVKLRLTAIKDGLLGNLGKHPIYKPGWKP